MLSIIINFWYLKKSCLMPISLNNAAFSMLYYVLMHVVYV